MSTLKYLLVVGAPVTVQINNIGLTSSTLADNDPGTVTAICHDRQDRTIKIGIKNTDKYVMVT